MAGDALKGYGLHSRATGLLNQPTTRLGQFVKAVNPFTARNLIEDAILNQAYKIDPDLKTNVIPGKIPLTKGQMYVLNPKVGFVVDLMYNSLADGTLAKGDPETYRKIRAMEAAEAGIKRAKERAFGIGPTED
jgi:hypothetical protein